VLPHYRLGFVTRRARSIYLMVPIRFATSEGKAAKINLRA